MARLVKIYDTTLRDGTQGEGVNFSMEDKVRIAKRLDQFGVHYIEGGWPGSNPKDVRFFQEMQGVTLKTAKLASFGSTRKPNTAAASDGNLQRLVESRTAVTTIYGKSWDFQVHEALNTTLEENVAMIADSVKFLLPHFEEVIYDAEHFFDGFKSNKDYAIKTLQAAEAAGAKCLVLCDTNGGTMPNDLVEIVREVKKRLRAPIGIHVHNDGDCAVANSLAAVLEGCEQVQGTINGVGERCGNANLCSIIPNLMLKMGFDATPKEKLADLRDLSRFVSEMYNRQPFQHQPYVGDSAFAHKGGMHVAAVTKHPETYEHVDPTLVGNNRRVLVSELAGQSNVLWKAAQSGIDLNKNTPETRQILETLKELENQGYEFEGAEASFELLMEKARGRRTPTFDLEGWRVIVEKRGGATPVSEATIKLSVKGIPEHTAAEGNGPVSALDAALRKALDQFYPNLKTMSLRDYKVRILEGTAGTSNDPWPVQYWRWLRGLLRGDLGDSLSMDRPVGPILVERIERSAPVALAAMLVTALLGIGLGTVAAVHENRPVDHAVSVTSFLGISVPEFFWGIVLILVVAGYFELLPSSGYVPLTRDPLGWLARLVLPVLTLALTLVAHTSRLTRSSMLDVLRSPYVRAARARGLPERSVVYRHALRNALLPTVTVLAGNFGWLMGGLVVVETVFAFPGLGGLLVFAIQQRDIPLVEAAIVVIAGFYALANLAADVTYTYLDPRIRYQGMP